MGLLVDRSSHALLIDRATVYCQFGRVGLGSRREPVPAKKARSLRHQDRIIALANAVARRQRDRDGAVLLHGDFHAGNLLVDSNNKLVAIDPTPAFGDPEQDIADAVAKNDWGQVLPTRVKRLAEACHADVRKVAAYARIAAWNCGIFHTAIRRVSTFEVLTRRVSIIRET
jgi:aminoglycoside phosphotransferase (APT) family kinase protein